MPGSPDLVVQSYANVGTGWAASVHRACLCEFEYQYRWPQFFDALLSGDPDRVRTAVDILEERDRTLEQHIHDRCDAGLFEYPSRWPQFYDALLSADDKLVREAVDILEERDRALETHIASMTCFGVDYVHGVTCEFDYPTRWQDLAGGLLSGDAEQLRATVGLLQTRDIELETHLTNRVCGNIDVHGLLPDSVTQVYENVVVAPTTYPSASGDADTTRQWFPGDFPGSPIPWPDGAAANGATVYETEAGTGDALSFLMPAGRYSGLDTGGNQLGMTLDGFVDERFLPFPGDQMGDRILTITASTTAGVVLQTWTATFTVHRQWQPDEEMNLNTFAAGAFTPAVPWVLRGFVDPGPFLGTFLYLRASMSLSAFGQSPV